MSAISRRWVFAALAIIIIATLPSVVDALGPARTGSSCPFLAAVSKEKFQGVSLNQFSSRGEPSSPGYEVCGYVVTGGIGYLITFETLPAGYRLPSPGVSGSVILSLTARRDGKYIIDQTAYRSGVANVQEVRVNEKDRLVSIDMSTKKAKGSSLPSFDAKVAVELAKQILVIEEVSG
jgi:hypothetical protein